MIRRLRVFERKRNRAPRREAEWIPNIRRLRFSAHPRQMPLGHADTARFPGEDRRRSTRPPRSRQRDEIEEDCQSPDGMMPGTTTSRSMYAFQRLDPLPDRLWIFPKPGKEGLSSAASTIYCSLRLSAFRSVSVCGVAVPGEALDSVRATRDQRIGAVRGMKTVATVDPRRRLRPAARNAGRGPSESRAAFSNLIGLFIADRHFPQRKRRRNQAGEVDGATQSISLRSRGAWVRRPLDRQPERAPIGAPAARTTDPPQGPRRRTTFRVGFSVGRTAGWPARHEGRSSVREHERRTTAGCTGAGTPSSPGSSTRCCGRRGRGRESGDQSRRGRSPALRSRRTSCSASEPASAEGSDRRGPRPDRSAGCFAAA